MRGGGEGDEQNGGNARHHAVSGLKSFRPMPRPEHQRSNRFIVAVSTHERASRYTRPRI
jgi:hypothetical protein